MVLNRVAKSAGGCRRLVLSKQGRMYSSAPTTCDVVVVGCGSPNRSMGWYHTTQLLQMPNARLTDIIEPWYLGSGAGTHGADTFERYRGELEQKHSVAFHPSVSSLKPRSDDSAAALYVINSRTADMPVMFHAALDAGASHIYLEKPGATTVGTAAPAQLVRDLRGVGS